MEGVLEEGGREGGNNSLLQTLLLTGHKQRPKVSGDEGQKRLQVWGEGVVTVRDATRGDQEI